MQTSQSSAPGQAPNPPQQQPVAPQPGAVSAGQAQQQMPHHPGLNGGWQSDRDYQDRRKMIAKIVHLLQQRKPNAPDEWLKKLPQMAKRLEESLYRSAKSFDQYNDTSTLKQRLQQLAVNIGMKTKKLQQLQQQQQQQKQQMALQQAPAATTLPSTSNSSSATPNGQRMVNLSDINPMVAPSQPLKQTVPLAQPIVQSRPSDSQPPSSESALPGAQAKPPQNGSKPVSDRQQVLRHQQQRLLLLRHAAKCQHEDGKCRVTPHCAGMKRLWKHIAECKNQKCLVPHCVSSRYVLSHYHRCKDVRCPVCGPVREAIHRSHEKQKQMQALKQRHDQAIQQNPPTGSDTVPQPTATGSNVSIGERAIKRQKTGEVQGFQQRPLQQPSNSNVVGGLRAGVSYSQAVATRPNVAPGIAFQNGQVITPKHRGPKVREDHTLINSFTIEQIELHMKSLHQGLQLSQPRMKEKCGKVLKALQDHQHGWVFNAPVDPVELGLPDYFEVVKKPMDLGTIRKKLENGVYTRINEFEEHVLLTFDNAMLYNPDGSVVWNMAKEMKDKFKSDFRKLLHQLEAEEDVKRRSGEACLLCGCEKLLFEPPAFYCNGLTCPSKRIRRNSYYYVGGNNQYHWCHLCFQELKDNSTIDLGEMQIKKEALVKKKNDELHEESWVQCDRCERWVHQICALFNTRQNKNQQSEYACPQCTIEERKQKNQLEGTSSTPMAEDLPRTKLSEHLEKHVREKVEAFIEKKAEQKVSQEGCSLEDAREKLQMGGAITIRQVTSMDRKLEVRERMKRRYAFKNYPDEFNFRCKCIVVFQNLDGVDVLLFGLYVYEHDEKNPAPNTRAVYISYLDSVHYMRPRQMRTLIYHEILISYLDYVRRRGFATAHIWACPPLKGDDYILYAKPEDQKTPKDDRLRQWYIDMLLTCQQRGIVGKITNMYDLYFSNPKNDATVVPYMEGDYFPAEVENIIKDLEEGKTGKKATSDGKKKDKKAKQKKKSGRQGTRSSGLDEEALKASGIFPDGTDSKSVEKGGRDYVMMKLGETIQPMKESFIVAYLAWEGAKEEDMIVPPQIQEYRAAHNITWKLESSEGQNSSSTVHQSDTSEEKIKGKVESPLLEASDPPKAKVSPDVENETISEIEPPSDVSREEPTTQTVTRKEDPTQEEEKKAEEGDLPEAMQDVEKSDDGPLKEQASSIPETDNTANKTPAEFGEKSKESEADVDMTDSNGPSNENKPAEVKSSDTAESSETSTGVRDGKFAAMAARMKRSLDGTVKEEKKEDDKKDDATTVTVKDSKGRIVKVLDDDEEELDCEFLNNRQAFLNLCQGNHYQFDMLRRAKHSSMMVLWHLHNRDAPKFVQQCATCSREILQGFRFHCPTCADFDQCQDCVRNPQVAKHPHPLKPIPVANGQGIEMTEAQRKERQRSIQLHMTLLLHAATCTSPKCPSANCTKMKGLLKHGSQCKIKVSGGCHVCKRIWALLQIHARQCKAKNCPIPNCNVIRERVRQLKKQQQAMDDRRRLEMNRHYGGAGR